MTLHRRLTIFRVLRRYWIFGAIAQLGERVVRNDEVGGSIPPGSTNPPPDIPLTNLDRHSCESGNPSIRLRGGPEWIPAFAGMTLKREVM